MTNSQRLAAVRRRLEQWLIAHDPCSDPNGSTSESTARIRKESFLIRDGFFCGRQFDAGSHRAVWFIEEDELKIYTHDGKWVCSLQGDDIDSAQENDQPGVIALRQTSESESSLRSDESDGQAETRRAA